MFHKKFRFQWMFVELLIVTEDNNVKPTHLNATQRTQKTTLCWADADPSVCVTRQ